MKIGLCMSVIGAGGGNDTVFHSIKNYLISQGHAVKEFTNSNTENNILKFGLYRQLQTINHPDMRKQDLLIFLTGIPPKTKVPIVYYHQQLPFSIFTRTEKPVKYNKGLWSIYYNIFSFIAGMKSLQLERQNISHYCISYYLQEYLEKYGIDATLVRPAIIQNDLPVFQKTKRVVTLCRISPEKNLEFNFKVLSGYRYRVFGTVNRFTAYYCRQLEKRLEPQHDIMTFTSRTLMLQYLLESKVYFSSSKETLGLAVLEGISAGCIPIVPDNTANKETVPFRELRYEENNEDMARELVQKALDNKFDYLLSELKRHVQLYKENNYQQLLEKKYIQSAIDGVMKE